MMINLNTLSREIHANNITAGWWNDGDTQCILTKLQLISTEIAEATEGERKNLMDDKLPHRKMGEVELADALIRTLDIAGRFNVVVTPIIINSFKTDYTIFAHHAVMTKYVGDMINGYIFNKEISFNATNSLISYVFKVSDLLGYDVIGAMFEKLEFNKTRPDHKPENRAKKHGKKV